MVELQYTRECLHKIEKARPPVISTATSIFPSWRVVCSCCMVKIQYRYITPSVKKGPIHPFTSETQKKSKPHARSWRFGGSKNQPQATIIVEMALICVRARYIFCHDICHVCMSLSITNLLSAKRNSLRAISSELPRESIINSRLLIDWSILIIYSKYNVLNNVLILYE